MRPLVSGSDIILNSKSEWMGQAIPRLTVEVKDSVKQIEYDGSRLVPKLPGKRSTPPSKRAKPKREQETQAQPFSPTAQKFSPGEEVS